MLRMCKVCHVIKPLEAFPKHRTAQDGHRQPCRQCFAVQNAARYAADLEAHRAKSRAQYHKHKQLKPSRRQNSDSKTCTICGLEQSLKNFALLGIKRDPSLRRPECKACRSQQRRGEERRRREQMSPEQLAQYQEQNRLRSKRYYSANTEKVLAKSKAWKKRNRQKLNRYQNAYNTVYLQKPHARQLLRERIKRYNKRHPERRADVQLRRVAQKKGSPITEKVMRELIYERDGGICHICHKPVARSEMSIDHLIPLGDKGPHTVRNVALAHKRCNFSRGKGRLPAQLRLF